MSIQDIKNFFQKKKYKHLTKEQTLLTFFGVLFFVFVCRLFQLQVVQANYYSEKLYDAHLSSTIIPPERGNIYLTTAGGKYERLTESVYMFDLAIDPTLIWEGKKQQLIEKIAPLLYEHFCVLNGSIRVTPDQCASNLARFNKKQIDIQSQLEGPSISNSDFSTGLVISQSGAIDLIKQTLDETIVAGYRPKNYISSFDENIITDLQAQNFVGIEIDGQDVYLNPNTFEKSQIDEIVKFFKLKKLEKFDKVFWDKKSKKRAINYIKIASFISPEIADKIQNIKDDSDTLWRRARNRTYVFTGENSITPEKRKEIASHEEGSEFQSLILERYPYRVYPYGTTLAHVLGYIDKNGNPIYGIEQYYDTYLKGKEGKSTSLMDKFIGTIASNNVDIQQAENGKDIYLTIDPALQAFVEQLIKKSYADYKADDISVIVMETSTGKIRAQATYPNFDPNNPQKEFEIQPITGEWQKIIDDDTYVDVPFLYQSGNSLKISKVYDQRKDPSLTKYMFKNIYGSNIFVDKNIRYSYEPGSVFKGFTLAIGLDSDSIFGSQTYFDKGYVEVGPFKISNVDHLCNGTNSFLHAFQFSCNSGMVKIFSEVGKQVYYSYIDKLGFGKQTGVELAMEDPGKVDQVGQMSVAQMFNNSFGQGLRVTPMQIAAGYSALVNGGILYKPSIVEKICPQEYQKTSDIGSCEVIVPRAITRVVSESTSEQMRAALVSVVTQGHSKAIQLSGYDLGGKTGTAQIAFKGKYMFGVGWSNATFVGMLTQSNPRYIVVVRVSRPRNNVYADSNAQPIFGMISKYLLSSDGFTK